MTNHDNNMKMGFRKVNFFIPREMVVTGSFHSNSSGQVEGIVNGDINVKKKIVIEKTGVVNGDIIAEEVVVFGKITGDVKHCLKMTVRSGAVIRGNILTDEIHIEKNTVIDGLIIKKDTYTIIGKKSEKPQEKNAVKETEEDSVPSETTLIAERETWF